MPLGDARVTTQPVPVVVRNLWLSVVRTIVPVIVGFLLSLPIVHGLGVSTEQATSLVTAALIGVYYVLVRFLESKWPKLGWLLGTPVAPTYAPVADGAHVVTSLPASPPEVDPKS